MKSTLLALCLACLLSGCASLITWAQAHTAGIAVTATAVGIAASGTATIGNIVHIKNELEKKD